MKDANALWHKWAKKCGNGLGFFQKEMVKDINEFAGLRVYESEKFWSKVVARLDKKIYKLKKELNKMKLRSPAMIIMLAIIAAIALLDTVCHADTLQWDTPAGLFNLNLKTTESLIGYDGVLKQAIAGVDLPIYTSPLNIATLKLGADAPWQSHGATVEPMVLAGHNLFGDIPFMDQYPNAQLNIFGRYASESGKAGAGIAFTWAFATPAESAY